MYRILVRSGRVRSALLGSAAVLVSPFGALAQTERPNLPPVTVTAPEQKRAATARPAQQSRTAARAARVVRVRNPAPASTQQATGLETPAGGSLTVPTTAQARALIERTPGGVALVPDTAFKNGPANTIKDVLGWVPGVITQTRWGPDGRISIRGSGLTRNFGNRGINVYMDGIPINTADGLFDLFEIDPTAYRYVEVYKGANALRYGANALGGAINFVTPTGRDAPAFDARVDAGSFGYLRGQASTAGASGPYDWFVNASAQREDGYREHSRNDVERLNANFGYQFSPDAETRFYLNANSWRAQLPGEADQGRSAEFAADRGSRVRAAGPAAQHRLGSYRQQDHAAIRCYHGGLRHLHPPAPRRSSDLSVPRLHRRRLRRLCPSDRRPYHWWLPQPLHRRRELLRPAQSTMPNTSI